ncbi:hypothetical protein AB5I41_00995 [Sphingomonas sp. MMS24-JH45]
MFHSPIEISFTQADADTIEGSLGRAAFSSDGTILRVNRRFPGALRLCRLGPDRAQPQHPFARRRRRQRSRRACHRPSQNQNRRRATADARRHPASGPRCSTRRCWTRPARSRRS